MTNIKSGFVSIIGQPNVGKSTLLNTLAGEKLAIISNKPQTTRNKIQTIVTKDDYQAIFIDTPGIHAPKSRLGKYMVSSAEGSVADVDAILFLVKPEARVSDMDRQILSKLKNTKAKLFLIINKVDTIDKSKLLKIIDTYKDEHDFTGIIPISALNNHNVTELMNEIIKILPEGPKYFPDDMITDQPECQIIAEIIREKALYLLQDEIPHGIAVEISGMKKRDNRDLIDVTATIYIEKDSHKGIILGKNGSMIKNIGSSARIDIQKIFGSQINLELWIKVKKNWRDSDFLLRNFGYSNK